jgi:type I restriction enzyme S subunit
MNDWKQESLRDICTLINRGVSPKYVESGTVILNQKCIRDNRINYSECKYTSSEKKVSIEKYLQELDILVNSTGTGTLGRTAQIKSLNKDTLVDTHITIVRANNKMVDPVFVAYQISLKEPEIISLGKGATNQQELGRDELGSIIVNLPPLPTQKRIAAILSAYDDLIENNLKRIKLLEEIAQRTYEEWFVKFRVNGEQLPMDEETGLPVGWMNMELGSLLVKLESGGRPKGGIDKELKVGIPSIGAENVLGLGQYKYGNEKIVPNSFFEKMRKGIVEDKDILVYKDGAYIGKTSMFQDGFPHEKCAVNEHVFLINTGKSELQNYLFFTLNRREYFMKMQSLNSNSAQPGINQEKLKSLEIMVPTLSIINDFHLVANPLIQQIFILAKMNEKLNLSRDILLPRLMSGTINVES